MALHQRDRRRLSGDSSLASPRYLLATAVVALIAAAALLLLVLRPGDGGQPAATAPSAGAAPAAPVAPAADQVAPVGDGSVCGLPGGDQVVPVTDPGTRWELVGTMAAPTAPETVGPGVVEAELRSCFARTPTGVLYAAANFLTTASDPALRLPAAQQLTAAGEGRDRLLEYLSAEGPGGTGTGAQIAGYTFLAYTADDAVVDLAVTSDGTPVHLTLSLRWEAGDWKVVVPPTGQPLSGIAPLPSLTGYTPWAGA